MPRPLSEYTWSEVFRMRPLIHYLKRRRYLRMDAAFSQQTAIRGDEASAADSLRGKNVTVTIAFNDPQVLNWHLTLTKKYVANSFPLVCDNSSREDSAREIESLCRDLKVTYLRLPTNPWSGRNGSRSHGLAMNWVWRRVILPSRAEAFGFLDHDLFPLAQDDPFALLETFDFYGDKRWAGRRWFLWAGYCFFRKSAIAHQKLDFGLDWFCGLDTGGANWELLYRNTNPSLLPEREINLIAALSGISIEDAHFETRGDWIHEVGCMGKKEHRPAKRIELGQFLKPHLASEMKLTQLTATSNGL